ncbi:MAG: hypothetical protein IJ835_06725 [Muribaculaceae bacterium]|nr:hypothetical protein [Muribaculaceae bacterium]
MKKTAVNITDMVFAKLVAGGRVIATLCKSNFSSLDEVVNAMRSLAGSFIGLAQLTIRNKTQGWDLHLALANARLPRIA